jgi:hypothetical protein
MFDGFNVYIDFCRCRAAALRSRNGFGKQTMDFDGSHEDRLEMYTIRGIKKSSNLVSESRNLWI